MIFSPITIKSVISRFVEYLSKSVTNYWLNCVAMSLREQTISYNINQILFHPIEMSYQPKFVKIFELLETCIVNSSTKYHSFLMYRTKVIRKRTMVTDFPAQLTVYIHPKTLRFLALFWMGRVLHIWWLWKKLFAREGWYLHTKNFLFQALKWHQNETCASLVSRAIAV